MPRCPLRTPGAPRTPPGTPARPAGPGCPSSCGDTAVRPGAVGNGGNGNRERDPGLARLSRTFPTQSMGPRVHGSPSPWVSALAESPKRSSEPPAVWLFSALVTLEVVSLTAAQDSLPLFISAKNNRLSAGTQERARRCLPPHTVNSEPVSRLVRLLCKNGQILAHKWQEEL